jgi:hypothetical protein
LDWDGWTAEARADRYQHPCQPRRREDGAASSASISRRDGDDESISMHRQRQRRWQMRDPKTEGPVLTRLARDPCTGSASSLALQLGEPKNPDCRFFRGLVSAPDPATSRFQQACGMTSRRPSGMASQARH